MNGRLHENVWLFCFWKKHQSDVTISRTCLFVQDKLWPLTTLNLVVTSIISFYCTAVLYIYFFLDCVLNNMKLLFIVVICCLSVLMDTVVPCHQAASVTPEPPAALTSKTVVFQQSPVCSGMRRSHRHFRFVCLCTLWSQLVQHQRSRRFIRV